MTKDFRQRYRKTNRPPDTVPFRHIVKHTGSVRKAEEKHKCKRKLLDAHKKHMAQEDKRKRDCK